MDPTQLAPLQDPMGAADPLAGLRDIHLPEAISFWPLAPGWWIAAGVALVVAALVAYVLYRRRIGLARAARDELARITAGFDGDGDIAALAAGLALLLRRVSLARFPRAEVAALHGRDWCAFLQRTGRMDAATAEALAVAVYTPPAHLADDDAEVWRGHASAVSAWIRRVA